MSDILEKLRRIDLKENVGDVHDSGKASLNEFGQSGVKFASSHPKIENLYYKAVHDLMQCVVNNEDGTRMLIEGADFIGCWLESTGTINTEIFSRFCPETARDTFRLFAKHLREDGLIPYKVTSTGPAYRQVQMVTPLARSVWALYCQNKDKEFLQDMYHAIAQNDNWLTTYRNTRGTGCVEAFATFDTGCDASPRFWHCPDVPYTDDPAKCDPNSVILPFLAPDMTANVYCQRKYLAKMAEELGMDTAGEWNEKAGQSLKSLMTFCYDEADKFFYDRDNLDRFVRIQSDNLMRVYACEACDDDMFKEALELYFLNTKKFFTRYPITTIAIDDPRFYQTVGYNSWSGQNSFLTQIRVTRAFEYHRRYVELTWIMHPILTALSRFTQFSGSLSPWLGFSGYKDNYTPTMVCVLDYIEKMCGICPNDDQSLWFTSLILRGMDYGEPVALETGYSRNVNGALFELTNDGENSVIYKDGKQIYSFPYGIRLVTSKTGELQSIIGMVPQNIAGEIVTESGTISFAIEGNEIQAYQDGNFVSIEKKGVVPPQY